MKNTESKTLNGANSSKENLKMFLVGTIIYVVLACVAAFLHFQYGWGVFTIFQKILPN